MPISTEEALSSYGFVYTLANSIPELKSYLDQAIAGGWTAQKLTATIESSTWWNTHADTVRNLAVAQATDPATYSQNLAYARNLINLKARQLGRSLTADQLDHFAHRTLVENPSWDEQVLNQWIGSIPQLLRGDSGALMGNAAELRNHLSQVAQSYGVPYSEAWLEGWVQQIQVGNDSTDGWEAVMRARAKAAFPQFADQIEAGMTVRDIADPYIATYAQTLEVPESEITLRDSYVQKALSQAGPDGATRTAMPLWQFARVLKDDPRYDRTQQAKDDAFATLNRIGKDWGFVGSSS